MPSTTIRLATLSLAAVGAVLVSGCGSRQEEVKAENESVESVAKKVAGSKIRPRAGQWESTMKIEKLEMKGLPPEAKAMMEKQMGMAQTFTSCLTPEQADKPSAEFFQGNRSSNCTYETFSMADGKIDAVMTCKEGGQTQNMTMQGTYGEEQYDIRVSADGEAKPGMPMSMVMHMSSKRVGECKN